MNKIDCIKSFLNITENRQKLRIAVTDELGISFYYFRLITDKLNYSLIFDNTIKSEIKFNEWDGAIRKLAPNESDIVFNFRLCISCRYFEWKNI